MSRAVQAEIGQLLADHLDCIQPDLERLSRPYDMAAEYRRRVELAELYVEDMPCRCYPGRATRCHRHDLEQILAGDE